MEIWLIVALIALITTHVTSVFWFCPPLDLCKSYEKESICADNNSQVLETYLKCRGCEEDECPKLIQDYNSCGKSSFGDMFDVQNAITHFCTSNGTVRNETAESSYRKCLLDKKNVNMEEMLRFSLAGPCVTDELAVACQNSALQELPVPLNRTVTSSSDDEAKKSSKRSKKNCFRHFASSNEQIFS